MCAAFLLLLTIRLSNLYLCGGKSLIISIDNRDLSTNINDNQYASMTAVINLDYAKQHGYDFAYIQNTVTGLVTEANTKFPNDYKIPPTNIAKDVATAFHVGLKQFRAASWAKLPPIWHIITTMGQSYDFIWYVDSDACISPLHRNRTIEESVLTWERETAVIRGNKKVSQSSFIFFNNKPWRDNMPCAGSFIFRPKYPLTESIVREWWDFDMPAKNFKHFHEQDALWHMIEAESVDTAWIAANPGKHFQMNSSTYSVTTEKQFPSAWKRYEELWLCHVASYNYAVRMPILYQFLRLISRDGAEAFKESVLEIQQKHTVAIKSLEVTEKMEIRSAQDTQRLTRFPPHDEATQSAWYDSFVSTKDLPIIPAQIFHEGRLIHRKGAFWMVCNGTRHGFENFDTFLNLGFHKEFGFAVSNADIDALPMGTSIGASSTITRLVDVHKTPICHGLVNYIPYKMRQSTAVSTADLKTVTVTTATNTATTQSAIINAVNTSNKTCELDAKLEALVAARGTRAIMYLVSHDNTSEALAHKFAACKESWIRPVRIASTVFFESNLYREVLPQLQPEWEKYDYVITATYKTVAKQLHYNGFNQNLDMIRNLLETADKEGYDVVPFLRSGSGTMSFCAYWHGKDFKVAWDALLTELGFSAAVIRSLDETKPFYRNIYIIRPGMLKLLVDFMRHAMHVALTNPRVSALIAKDSRYKEGSEEVAMRIFGTKYYQLHPFIFERLPSFFLHSINAKICHYNTEGPCKYNS